MQRLGGLKGDRRRTSRPPGLLRQALKRARSGSSRGGRGDAPRAALPASNRGEGASCALHATAAAAGSSRWDCPAGRPARTWRPPGCMISSTFTSYTPPLKVYTYLPWPVEAVEEEEVSAHGRAGSSSSSTRAFAPASSAHPHSSERRTSCAASAVTSSFFHTRCLPCCAAAWAPPLAMAAAAAGGRAGRGRRSTAAAVAVTGGQEAPADPGALPDNPSACQAR